MKERKKPKAVIVGGSIAGLSCAYALISADWQVLVLEKSGEPPTGSPTGAGLGLDPLAQRFIEQWLNHPQLLDHVSLPLSIDQNQATVIDGNKKVTRMLTRDEEFNFRAVHWSDLHGLLHGALPSNSILWGHQFLSFTLSDDKTEVKVEARVLQTRNSIEITGDLLVAADGCQSSIRQSFIPELRLRYSGYSAWRGVLEYSGQEDSEMMIEIRKVYPNLGECLYVDMAFGTHAGLYELPSKRLNWIWYVNQPQPELKESSLTMKVSGDMIQNMHQEAEEYWTPELANIIKATKEPFINVIYDADPLENLFWDNVVLIGDAAHPTTPHCLRSTNMSILDAAVLGMCLKKRKMKDLSSALHEYQSLRLPVIKKQVLHSRRLGRIKQGLTVSDSEVFNPRRSSPEELHELQQKNMPFFYGVPLPDDSEGCSF